MYVNTASPTGRWRQAPGKAMKDGAADRERQLMPSPSLAFPD